MTVTPLRSASLPIAEPVFVPETPFHGVAAILPVMGQCRASLYIERPSIGMMPHERAIVAHLLAERCVMMQLAAEIVAACEGGSC